MMTAIFGLNDCTVDYVVVLAKVTNRTPIEKYKYTNTHI